MSADCAYLSSQLKFREEGARTINSLFTSDAEGNVNIVGRNLIFMHFPRDKILEQLRELQKYAKTNKLHISGFVTICFMRGDKIAYENIKVSGSTITPSGTSVKIVTKNPDARDKKRPKSIDEKLELVKRFYVENKRLPAPGDVYENEKIGLFLAKIEEDKKIYEELLTKLGVKK